MLKRLLILFLLFAASAAAQTQTLVSGTLTDPNGVAYYPATVTACLNPSTLNPTVGGRQVNPNQGANYCVGPTNTNPNGSFSMALWGNANITPGGTTWIFTVQASGTAPPAGNGTLNFSSAGVTVSGATQDVSTNINSVGTAQLKTSTLSSSGAISPLSYGAKWGWRLSGNCTATSGSNIVNCTGGDIAFTAADIGKIAFMTCGTTQINSSLNTTAGLIITQTTITGVNSATQATVGVNSSANCTPSSSVSGNFAYGPQDDAPAILLAQTQAYAVPGAPCKMHFPAGYTAIAAPIINNDTAVINGCYGNTPNLGVIADTTSVGPRIDGEGNGATVFIVLPSFDFTQCIHGVSGKGCNGTIPNLQAHDFGFTGMQNPGSGTHNVNFWESNGNNAGGICDGGSTIENVNFSGIFYKAVNFVTFDWGRQMCNNSFLKNVNVLLGYNTCQITGNGNILNLFGLQCFGATNNLLTVNLSANSTVNDFGGQYVTILTGGSSTELVNCGSNGGGLWHSSGSEFGPEGNTTLTQAFMFNAGVGTSCQFSFDNSSFFLASGNTADSRLFNLNSTSTVHLGNNNTFSIAGSFNRFGVTSATDKIYNDGPSNKLLIGGLASAFAQGTYISQNAVVGACTGVGTAASTLALRISGTSTTGTGIPSTCTSTTLDAGRVMQGAGNLSGLITGATAAGTNASSGVVTVLKNGGATTITCTIGTSTTCNDFVHQVAFVAGDLISIQFTTQAADTLAGVKASVDIGN